MRHWLTPLIVLALLLGGTAANARYVARCVDGWCAGLEAALSAAGAEDGAHRMPYIHVLNAWNCGANETGPVPRARRCAPAF